MVPTTAEGGAFLLFSKSYQQLIPALIHNTLLNGREATTAQNAGFEGKDDRGLLEQELSDQDSIVEQ